MTVAAIAAIAVVTEAATAVVIAIAADAAAPAVVAALKPEAGVARETIASEGGAALRVHVLRPELATLPRYASEAAAGLDLAAALDAPLTLAPLARAAVPTGLAVALPVGHEGQVRPRSGLASQHGITVLNAPGTIDEDYRGELKVLLVNLSADPYTIAPGDRIAQLVIAPVRRVAVNQVKDARELGETPRGAAGFGSSGR